MPIPSKSCPGLSPRVRGSPESTTPASPNARSIPASAGEPSIRICPGPDHGVYPRECGGAGAAEPGSKRTTGLSPRVRGSQDAWPRTRDNFGSIPASAGEPVVPVTGLHQFWVYPRECGGAPREGGMFKRDWGLSPRVRGSPFGRRPRGRRAGSIPASAGEPPGTASGAVSWRVYPRECGGAPPIRLRRKPSPGLSPRVRGSRIYTVNANSLSGSIPASAGEP